MQIYLKIDTFFMFWRITQENDYYNVAVCKVFVKRKICLFDLKFRFTRYSRFKCSVNA